MVAKEAVPCNDPVILPDTFNEPVICTVDPAANIKFDLVDSLVPLPKINALCIDEDKLN